MARISHLCRGDVRETDDLRVLDYDGSRAFKLFRFGELGSPLLQEPGQVWFCALGRRETLRY
jgi:hypothetical protein